MPYGHNPHSSSSLVLIRNLVVGVARHRSRVQTGLRPLRASGRGTTSHGPVGICCHPLSLVAPVHEWRVWKGGWGLQFRRSGDWRAMEKEGDGRAQAYGMA